MDNKKLKNEIDLNGYALIKDFFNYEKLEYLKLSLLDVLNYINYSDEKDLRRKYYEIKKFDPKLISNWYDIAPNNIDMLNSIHTPDLLNFVKFYFDTKTLFSGRAAIHVHDNENDKLLLPHQETNQFAVDCLLVWIPLWDTNKHTGGLTIFEKSHNQGYFDHILEDPSGKKKWTHKYTNISENVYKKFKRTNLEVKAGTAVLAHSSLIHCGYPLTDKETVRITVTERFNPLKKIPYLKDSTKPKKIPYVGTDYNLIKD
jgi:hypothetical protein